MASCAVDQHTVLREDSLWNQIIAQDFTLIGGNYLRQLLRTEVTKIIRSPSTSDKKVAESASLLLKEICSSLSYCPRYLPPPALTIESHSLCVSCVAVKFRACVTSCTRSCRSTFRRGGATARSSAASTCCGSSAPRWSRPSRWASSTVRHDAPLALRVSQRRKPYTWWCGEQVSRTTTCRPRSCDTLWPWPSCCSPWPTPACRPPSCRYCRHFSQ
jgi:hypothetical protein